VVNFELPNNGNFVYLHFIDMKVSLITYSSGNIWQCHPQVHAPPAPPKSLAELQKILFDIQVTVRHDNFLY